jgi:hypothetical protein
MLLKDNPRHGRARPLTQPFRIFLCLALSFTLWLVGSRYYLRSRPARAVVTPQSEALYAQAPRQAKVLRSMRSPDAEELRENQVVRRQVLAYYVPHTRDGTAPDFASLQSLRYSALWDYPVIRPFDGFYDATRYQTRHKQGRLARAYGIDGFVYRHRWDGSAALGGGVLEAMLVDGEPNLPFAIAWDNSAVVEEGYGEAPQWRAHFDWLLQFFLHKRYLLRDGRPMLLFARCRGEGGGAQQPPFETMVRLWREWALGAGLKGLYIVQMNGEEWAPGVLQPPEGLVDGVVEFYPHLGTSSAGGGGSSAAPSLRTLVGRNASSFQGLGPLDYFRGAHAGHNDAPQGPEHVVVYHPTNLRAALRAQLALTPPGGFVLLNAWNDWGAGCAVEPSEEQGFSWLEAVKGAVEDVEGVAPPAALGGGRIFFPPLAPAGVVVAPPAPPTADRGVCFLVRTYTGHDDASEDLYNLGRMLRTLVALENTAWEAHVVDTGERVFYGLQGIISEVNDPRIHHFPTPPALRQPYVGRTSSYDLTDYALKQACLGGGEKVGSGGGGAQVFVVTNGDNFYTPDAFNYLPPSADMLVMNFFSRYTVANAITFSNADMEGCCSRFATYRCPPSSLEVGFVDVGAMVISIGSWKAAGLSFAQFHGACGESSCHDGALAQYALDKLKWRVAYHHPAVCAMHHNPNPVSCALVGGLYFDDRDWAKAKCVEPAELDSVPLQLSRVDWLKFMSGDGCVCEESSE